ncbi:MAG TPA: DoxX family protein [Chitinophaga sp.]|uniref:DoxX family protein n=1 Tax=Chitinophaga sp. TaxID=1869181 RepID=UPI002B5EAD63|nr:DoxX family protein [Chitinophaga sp.]HVI43215.1 DoxX family protein [Chitinophaga sp.]
MKEKNTTTSRGKLITYWIITGFVAFELALGALWDFDLVNKSYVPRVMAHLGYPPYVAIIFGCWKLPASYVIAGPRMLRLKEWAYAGSFFTFTGAAASHLAAGDGPAAIISPLVFATLTVASWALRPSWRKL